MNKALVIIAASGSGKSSLSEYKPEYNVLDLDHEVNGRYSGTDKAVPIGSIIIQEIKDNLDKCDFILLNYHRPLVEMLAHNKIDYVLVYPENTEECKAEWARRNEERNTQRRWKIMKFFWNAKFKEYSMDRNAKAHYMLKQNQHLSDIIDRIKAEHTENDNK